MAAAVLVLVLLLASPVSAQVAAPAGQITIAATITLAPTWFDPAETPGVITPFLTLYALHDALVKPMPGNPWAPCLAESWTMSKDGLVYEFVLRKGVKFHNGDPVTAEDVKFTFERYKGASAKILKDHVKEIQLPAPNHVRFVLREAWPDFMAFYGTSATGAGWIVPKKYIEKVGEDGFARHPIGLGPFRFLRMSPGTELVLEANEQYWRKKPTIKTIVF
jgi:peptide/nickel transport system substrate-binding protein